MRTTCSKRDSKQRVMPAVESLSGIQYIMRRRTAPGMQSHNHQEFINRFVVACQADERVVAAIIGTWLRS
jgi:hypothetical protein